MDEKLGSSEQTHHGRCTYVRTSLLLGYPCTLWRTLPLGLVWQSISTAGEDEKGKLGVLPWSMSPAAHLLFPVDDQGMPVTARSNSIMRQESRSNASRVSAQSKGWKTRYWGLLVWFLWAEVLGFVACKSRRHSPILQIHPFMRKDLNSLSSISMLFFYLPYIPLYWF